MSNYNNPIDDAIDSALRQNEEREKMLFDASNLLSQRFIEKNKNDPQYSQRLVSHPEQAVQELFTDMGQIANVKPELLRPLAEAMTYGLQSKIVPGMLENNLSNVLYQTVEDIRLSYNQSLNLSNRIFYVSLIIIPVAFVLAIAFQDNSYLTVIFGVGGVSGIFGVMLSNLLKPINVIRESTESMVQLLLVFMTHQVHITRLGKRLEETPSTEEAIQISQQMTDATNALISKLGRGNSAMPPETTKSSVIDKKE